MGLDDLGAYAGGAAPVPRPRWRRTRIEQRRGIGRALVRLGLEWSRRDGVPAFLETSKPETMRRSTSISGSEVETAADAPQGGPHVWFMRFDP